MRTCDSWRFFIRCQCQCQCQCPLACKSRVDCTALRVRQEDERHAGESESLKATITSQAQQPGESASFKDTIAGQTRHPRAFQVSIGWVGYDVMDCDTWAKNDCGVLVELIIALTIYNLFWQRSRHLPFLRHISIHLCDISAMRTPKVNTTRGPMPVISGRIACPTLAPR